MALTLGSLVKALDGRGTRTRTRRNDLLQSLGDLSAFVDFSKDSSMPCWCRVSRWRRGAWWWRGAAEGLAEGPSSLKSATDPPCVEVMGLVIFLGGITDLGVHAKAVL